MLKNKHLKRQIHGLKKNIRECSGQKLKLFTII